ncbi:MAG: copper resistance protein CopC [Chloroflexi bacterium]|nr:copper resistance protein CopC [Chloroflexota bacterium]
MKARQAAIVFTGLLLAIAGSAGSASAHSYPQTSDPQTNARLDNAPAHILINYDGGISPNGSSIVLLDATDSPVPTAPDPTTGGRQASVHPTSDLTPGPYTVNWTSLSSEDGHTAEGFYTFVVNGGPVGIVDGTSQAQSPAADMQATLTVTSAPDGGSLLRVDLDKTTGVERIRIRLYRPDLGEDLLDTTPTGDGGWALANNEVAIPGDWHADVIVRRTGVVDDAQGGFDFSVDAASGTPTVASAAVQGPHF